MKKLVCFLAPTETRVSEAVSPTTGEVITDSQGNPLMSKTYRVRTKQKIGIRNNETGRISSRHIEPILLADESVEELVSTTAKKDLVDVLFFERDEDGNRLFSEEGGYKTKKVKAFELELFVQPAQREIEEGVMRSFYQASLTDQQAEVLFETSMDANGQYQLSTPSSKVVDDTPTMEVSQPTETQSVSAPSKEQLLETIKSMQALGLDIPQELVLQLATAK